jgi:hypothetical protein
MMMPGVNDPMLAADESPIDNQAAVYMLCPSNLSPKIPETNILPSH